MNHVDKHEFFPNKAQALYFPLENNMGCFAKGFDSKSFFRNKPCPLCDHQAMNLNWIDIRSPDITWNFLCGRQSQQSICPEC
jgi:hypothetical protein